MNIPIKFNIEDNFMLTLIQTLTPEQNNHVDAVQYRFIKEVAVKYTAGQAQHGGNLWEKPVLKELRQEAIDQVVYSDVLIEKQQKILFSVKQLDAAAQVLPLDDDTKGKLLAQINFIIGQVENL